MSTVVDRDDGRGSAWQDGQPGCQEIRISKAEYQMLLHLRMLDSGIHAVRIRKVARGMKGLREFRVTEVVIPRVSGQG